MDELIKRLRNCATQAAPCKTCDMMENVSCTDTLMKQAADAIEELSQDLDSMNEANIALYGALPRWIPVTEQLPEVRTWVLCFCRANSFDVFRMTDEGHWQYGNRSIYMKGYVTHWMPLPTPPTAEEGE